MKLYFMRHGPAEDLSPTGRDADRALTPSGRDRVRDVARELAKEDEAPFVVMSSPLVRALQTAEIVAAVTDLAGRAAKGKAHASGATGAVDVRREMAPGGDALALVHEAARAGRKRVMVVGHEPDLSMLVERLVGRAPSQGMLKAMVVSVKIAVDDDAPGRVEGAGLTSTLRFVLDPKTLDWQRA